MNFTIFNKYLELFVDIQIIENKKKFLLTSFVEYK